MTYPGNGPLELELYPAGFEDDDELRSSFIRELLALQGGRADIGKGLNARPSVPIPLHLIQYWHDEQAVPDDVRACLSSWSRLSNAGFRFSTFNDTSAAAYIASRYTKNECAAFARCHHPAMRCDYLRMCVLVVEGGFYVDADDVLLGEGWRQLFNDDAMKLQPLCYDIPTGEMLSANEIWREGVSSSGRIFYVNNDPIVAPPEHPVLRRALARATERLLSRDSSLEIQSTTGPGNLTAALAAHTRDLLQTGRALDFELLRNWGVIAKTRWDLSYRGDARNWRNTGAI